MKRFIIPAIALAAPFFTTVPLHGANSPQQQMRFQLGQLFDEQHLVNMLFDFHTGDFKATIAHALETGDYAPFFQVVEAKKANGKSEEEVVEELIDHLESMVDKSWKGCRDFKLLIKKLLGIPNTFAPFFIGDEESIDVWLWSALFNLAKYEENTALRFLLGSPHFITNVQNNKSSFHRLLAHTIFSDSSTPTLISWILNHPIFSALLPEETIAIGRAAMQRLQPQQP